MPDFATTPAKPRQRPSTTQNTPRATVELEKLNASKLGETQSIKDKVRQWQSLAEIKRSSSPSREPSPSRGRRKALRGIAESAGTENELERSLSRGLGDEQPAPPLVNIIGRGILDEDLRAASAPRKRVVSDEHWKSKSIRKRETKKEEAQTLKLDTTPQKIKLHDVCILPGSKKPDAWVRHRPPAAEKPVKPREARSRSPTLEIVRRRPAKREESIGKSVSDSISSELQSVSGGKSTDSDAILEMRKPRKKDVDMLEADLVPKRLQIPTKFRDSDSREDGVLDRESPLKSSKPRPGSKKPQHNVTEDASVAEIKLPRSSQAREAPPFSSRQQSIAGRRGASFAASGIETKDDHGHADVITPPRMFGTRVEAWLGATTDPFADTPSRVARDAAAPPSVVSSTGSSRPSETWNGLSKPRQSRDAVRRSGRKISPETRTRSPMTESTRTLETTPSLDGTESSLTPTLKRRGARRDRESPVRKSSRHREDDSDITELRTVSEPSSTPIVPESLKIKRKSINSGKRTFPTTGNCLSTIASMDTIRTSLHEPETLKSINEGKVMTDIGTSDFHNMSGLQHSNSLRHNMTSHADLISILSMSKDSGNKSITSARSIRTTRSKAGSATIQELMEEFKSDESKYIRELRTLVDGVIPVLLSCVLSRSNSVKAVNLFGNAVGDSDPTGSIVSMGVALERLKSVHLRVPTNSPEALLMWASSAHRIYADYLKAWRMGFQDVVVNLAPADDQAGQQKSQPTWDDTLPRDEEGYVVNGDGEKVDVSYLLKRPLVRLKYLAKTFNGIRIHKTSATTEMWATKYQELVKTARERQDEERARLEDEAAAAIDTTRARDTRSLAPLAGVKIDATRCVRARDYFDLKLCHSTGQRVDCHVELVIRDDRPDRGQSGDLLVCEVDATSRWLLLPPIQLTKTSARNGDKKGEIIVMIRGILSDNREWHELLSFVSNDEQTASEWLDMLGHSPTPPEIPARIIPSTQDTLNSTAPIQSLILANPDSLLKPEPLDLQVPIGETASEISQQWPSGLSTSDSDRRLEDFKATHVSRKHVSRPSYSTTTSSRVPTHQLNPKPLAQMQHQTPTSKSEPPTPTQSLQMSSGEELYSQGRAAITRPSPQRQSSSIAHESLPAIPRLRPSGSEKNAAKDTGAQVKQTPNKLHKRGASHDGARTTPSTPHQIPSDQTPHSAPAKDLGGLQQPQFSPPSHEIQRNRRSSSPLKHEYAPSSASDRSSQAEDLLSDDEGSITSESSIEDALVPLPPLNIIKQPLQRTPPQSVYSPKTPETLTPSRSASQAPYRTVPPSTNTDTRTIASIFSWSDKGLWESLHPNECSVIVSPGLIEAFEMSAAHSRPSSKDEDKPDEPLVRPLIALELTPLVPLRRGTAIDISIRSPPTSNSLIQAGNNLMFRSRNNQECDVLYSMINQARINNPTYIALQNARGPYGSGNWSSYMDRRAPIHAGSGRAPGSMSSWWRFGSRRNSYRAGSTRRTASVSGQTESSVASMSSAISALRRFTSGARFNIGRSTVTTRQGDASPGSISESFQSSSSASGSSTPPAPVEALVGVLPTSGAPIAAIANAKVRLYERESASKWRDLGTGRLTITHPQRPSSLAGAPLPAPRRSEKRIVVAGKTRGETLLDATLGESAFERVARTGIAVSIWERVLGPNGEEGGVGKTGGVAGARVRVYMVQMKSEAETAYTFGLVGRLRY